MDLILIVLIVYAAFVAIFSIWSFLAMKADKEAAVSGEWRTSECKLHLLELLGGYPGSMLAQLCLRHKNRKPSYQTAFWLIVIGHIVTLVAVFYVFRDQIEDMMKNGQ